MTNLFRTVSSWLEAKRTAIATSDVTYRRGDRSVCVPATIGRTEYQQDDGYGIITKAESRDFLILAADLILDGMLVLPEVGDRIDEMQCDKTFTYEVLPIGGQQTQYRYSDPFRQTLRIHTKLIDEEVGT
jgi:hypothetical protein